MRAAAAVQTSGHFSDGISLHLLRAALGTEPEYDRVSFNGGS
jgi:hypothetical protein